MHRFFALLFALLLIGPAPSDSQLTKLRFPVVGDTPYTAQMVSVHDHSGSHFYFKDLDVVAYTGERGESFGAFTCSPSEDACGYRNLSLAEFEISGNYVGFMGDGSDRRKILNYRGHPGYDYKYTSGTIIVAPAAGTLFIPATDPVNSSQFDPWCKFHTFYQNHGGGLTSWYLHASSVEVIPPYNSPHTCPPDLVEGEQLIFEDTIMGFVKKGHPIGAVGSFGANADHLHFEVRLCDILPNGRIDISTCEVLDPYGWEWNSSDPAGNTDRAASLFEPLWENVTHPTVAETNLTPSPVGFTVTITGTDFELNNTVSLWNRKDYSFYSRITPGSVTPLINPTQIVADLAVDSPEDFVLKVESPSGPRSRAVTLLAPAAPPSSENIIPLLLRGQSAPGGGVFANLSTFYDKDKAGKILFSAEVDLTNDGLGDEGRSFSISSGQVDILTAPGISKVGAARINDTGAFAYGDASTPGRTQAIYMISSPGTAPVKIAEWGDPISAFPEMTYYNLRGPLELSESGVVLFSSAAFDSSINTVFCCSIFMYSQQDQETIRVVSDGDPSPSGGVFDISGPLPAQVTASGHIVFGAIVNGGDSGIFSFSPATRAMSSVVLQGDPAPLVGGTLAPPAMGQRSVSGTQLVFVANILGGLADQAIMLIDDLNADLTPRIVGFQGQDTGTALGGAFLTFDSFIHPEIRADGGVIFTARLEGASSNGEPINDGIFLWTGREFLKVAVKGDQLTTGGTINDPRNFIANDTGEITYFVASID